MNDMSTDKKEELTGLLKESENKFNELKIRYADLLPTLKLKDKTGLNAYLHRRKEIEDKYKENNNWDEIITTVVYCDESQSNEAFIDFVESIYKTKIKDAKHLQKLTGIQKETLEGLQECIYTARGVKYMDVVSSALRNGATLKELLKHKPKDYGLPASWYNGNREMNKEKTIKLAIHLECFFEGRLLQPDLRDLAKILEAPYSFILETKNFYESYYNK